MPAVEGKRSRRMIEFGILPIAGYMALLAGCSELPFMQIVLLMARETVFWSAFENTVRMTLFASHNYMRPVQFEFGTIVIEARRLPSIGGVARRAICSQTPTVRIIRLMARETILARRL